MGSDTPFDIAAFKHHLDTLYPNKIIDETYPVRPPAVAPEKGPTQGPVPTPPDVSTASPPVVARDNPPSGKPAAAHAEVASDATTSAASTAAAAHAEHLRIQRSFIADPDKMRGLLPLLLLNCDSNSDHSLDQSEITNGLKSAKLTDVQKDALTVMLSGFKAIHSEKAKTDTAGISDYDFAVLEKALDRKIDGDPIYNKEAIESIPKSLISGALASLAVTRGSSGKEKLLYAAGLAVTTLAVREGFLGVLQLFNANNGKYDAVQKDYLEFSHNYK